jgi:aerobic-type carbon monoxide dehydrogenase small subunit (CoxS/CutS family)
MTDYIPPNARFYDFEEFQASAAQDLKPITPINDISIGNTSRRDFLKAAIVSGAAVSAAGYVFRSSSAEAQGATKGAAAKSNAKPLSLKINGEVKKTEADPQETLLHVVRYRLGLTGTKLGCDRGECGACTVIIDGVATYSCSILAHSVKDRSVMTVEGVKGKDGGLHPVQKAFIAELGPQCGFCTPGQVMSAVALLDKTPKPTRDQVRHTLSGNLCRCGAYDHYTNGVMRAAQEA